MRFQPGVSTLTVNRARDHCFHNRPLHNFLPSLGTLVLFLLPRLLGTIPWHDIVAGIIRLCGII